MTIIAPVVHDESDINGTGHLHPGKPFVNFLKECSKLEELTLDWPDGRESHVVDISWLYSIRWPTLRRLTLGNSWKTHTQAYSAEVLRFLVYHQMLEHLQVHWLSNQMTLPKGTLPNLTSFGGKVDMISNGLPFHVQRLGHLTIFLPSGPDGNEPDRILSIFERLHDLHSLHFNMSHELTERSAVSYSLVLSSLVGRLADLRSLKISWLGDNQFPWVRITILISLS